LNLHASFNTGFRAPTLYNIDTPNTLSIIVGTIYDDPILCPGGIVNEVAGGIDIRDCGQRYQTLLGGNGNLGPEKSTAYSVGMDFQAWEGLRVTVDYWDYSLEGKIGPLSHASIFGSPERFSDFLIRCSDADPALSSEVRTCAFGGGGDPIAYVVQTNFNLGKTETSGIDLTAHWSGHWRAGQLFLNYRATYVADFDFERIPGDPMFSRAGLYFDGYPVPRYIHFLTLDWQWQHWSAQMQNRFVSGYKDCNAACGIAEEFFNDVSSYSLWGVALSYQFSEELLVSAHMENLFDTNPPFTNGGQLCTGCDNRFADPTGLSFGLTIRGHFN
jgi:iron complex outermembrane receptor protein